MDELTALAQAQGLSLEQCAKRYVFASLPHDENGWWFHEALGFAVKR
jgi:CRISPR-associated endonuclease/helicase Cas3